MEFGGEFLVGFAVIWGNSKDDDAGATKIGEMIAEVTGLGGAARGVILGIEVQDDALAAQAFERKALSLGAFQCEIAGAVLPSVGGMGDS